ncbi:MAG: VOC family protein [Acidimicrobiia bacterium]|nr:VOC family protein [Acidimicrobiia bacterium]
MNARLDHVVIGGTDLGLLVAWWKRETGLDPARGGAHEGFGTHNALIGMDDTSYVELIAHDPGQPNPGRPRPFGLDELEPNSVQLCTLVLAVDDIAAATDEVRAAGLDPGPVTAMRRMRRDGVELKWQLAIPPHAATAGILPALIQWGPGTPHPGLSLEHHVRIEEIVLGHTDHQNLQAALTAIGSDLQVSEASEPVLAARFSVAGGSDLWL